MGRREKSLRDKIATFLAFCFDSSPRVPFQREHDRRHRAVITIFFTLTPFASVRQLECELVGLKVDNVEVFSPSATITPEPQLCKAAKIRTKRRKIGQVLILGK